MIGPLRAGLPRHGRARPSATTAPSRRRSPAPWPRSGVTPGTPRYDEAQVVVRETMGWSKADVFAALLEPDEAAGPPRRSPRLRGDRRRRRGRADPGPLEVLARAARPAGSRSASRPASRPSTRDALLDALGWRAEVDLALSPADVGRGRPAPDLILGAMDRLGVDDPGAVAVVGDTVSDLEAGHAAGAGAVIGVLSGAHDEAPLAAAPHGDPRRRHRADRTSSTRPDSRIRTADQASRQKLKRVL